MKDFYAVDFETFYDKEYSLSKMSPWNYVFHEKFDAYLVAVYGEDISFVGHPSEFDWAKLDGKTLIMHNAGFDGLVVKRLQADGMIDPSLDLSNLVDTADMVVWLKAPRALKGASKELLGRDMDKAVRDKMKGKTYKDMVSAGGEEDLLKYGIGDAVNTYDLWVGFSDKWPEKERIASRMNREAGWYGFMVNKGLVNSGLVTLNQKLFDTEKNIPWIDEGEKPLSPKAIRAHGRKEGIPVPASLAKDNPVTLAWAKQYGEKCPWIKATSEWRSVNMLRTRVQAISNNIREDGTMPYSCKYYGAHTGRFSGGGEAKGGAFNMLNQPRKAMFGVDVRPMFIARPGHKLIISDLAQIEARLLLWRVGDTAFLDILREEGNLYQAYARKTGFYTGTGKFKDDDLDGYNLTKARVLGLGFGCGDKRFREMAETQYGVILTAQQAKEAVQGFRDENPLICKHWWSHQVHLRLSANARDKTHEVELRSGRDLVYFDPQLTGDREVKVRFERGGNLRKVYGGLLTENEIQATARDVLIDGMVAIDKAGYRYLLSVYDEIVVEVPEAKAEDAAREVPYLMTHSSPWAEGCPLDTETHISDCYLK